MFNLIVTELFFIGGIVMIIYKIVIYYFWIGIFLFVFYILEMSIFNWVIWVIFRSILLGYN